MVRVARPLRPLIVLIAALSLGAFAAGPASAYVEPMVSGGQSFNCALSDTGANSCWGSSWAGIMGTVPSGSHPSPVAIAPGSGAVSIASGGGTNCVLFGDGTVKCWGTNWDGELGRGFSSGAETDAVAVPGIAGAAGLWSGSANSFCARLADATAKCWGDDNHKSLGDGGTTDALSPVTVSGVANIKKIVPGNGGTTCALIADGTVKCWGYNQYGQVGNNTAGADVGTPALATGITNAIDIAVGGQAVCAVLATSQVVCWGSNFYGSLGTGESTAAEHHTPVSVPGAAGATQIAGSGADFCVLIADGTVKCWGLADTGETGSGTDAGKVMTPTTIPGVGGIAKLATSFGDAPCAMRHGGAVVCWGADDYGQSGVAPTAAIVAPNTLAAFGLISPRAAVASSISIPKKPKLDKKRKTFTLKGSVLVTPDPVVLESTACSGTATVSIAYVTTTIKHKKRVKKTHTTKASAPVALSGATCVTAFSKKLSAKTYARRKLSISATIPANAALLAVKTPVKHYTMPKRK